MYPRITSLADRRRSVLSSISSRHFLDGSRTSTSCIFLCPAAGYQQTPLIPFTNNTFFSPLGKSSDSSSHSPNSGFSIISFGLANGSPILRLPGRVGGRGGGRLGLGGGG